MSDMAKCFVPGCPNEFLLDESTRKWYEGKRLPLPKRCKSCREMKRIEYAGLADKPRHLWTLADYAAARIPYPKDHKRA